MARDEAKVRVRLDTRRAQSELRGLLTESRRTAGRIGSKLRGTVGRGLGVVGLGAGIGTGRNAVAKVSVFRR